MVGPDNGLLTLAAQSLGGVVEAVDIGDSPECLRPISATFHGRDVFAPVAAAPKVLFGTADPTDRTSWAKFIAPQRNWVQQTFQHTMRCDDRGEVTKDAGRGPRRESRLRHRDGSDLGHGEAAPDPSCHACRTPDRS